MVWSKCQKKGRECFKILLNRSYILIRYSVMLAFLVTRQRVNQERGGENSHCDPTQYTVCLIRNNHIYAASAVEQSVVLCKASPRAMHACSSRSGPSPLMNGEPGLRGRVCPPYWMQEVAGNKASSGRSRWEQRSLRQRRRPGTPWREAEAAFLTDAGGGRYFRYRPAPRYLPDVRSSLDGRD